MKKHITLILFSFLISFSSYAQYEMEWYKTGRHMYFPVGLQYNNGSFILNNTFSDTDFYKPAYAGNKLLPIGRLHRKDPIFNYNGFSTSISINEMDGTLSSSILTENSNVFYNAYSNGDTSIMFEKLYIPVSYRETNGSVITQVDTLYMQIKNSAGGFIEKLLPMTAFGNTTEKNGLCDDFTVLRTNDNHNIYGILRVRADSIQISGKTMVCDRKYSFVLCKFDYNGNFIWGHDICDADADFALISQVCSYQIDESGTGYFSGYILKYDAWILGDYFEFKGKQDPLAPDETFIIRFSADGKVLNKKFFNFYPGVSGINARFKNRLYFFCYVNFPFNNVGLAFSGSDSNLKADIGYVIGEMDTNFNTLWYKILPLIHDVKINSVTYKYQNRISLNVQSYSSSIINDKNELILGTSRMNQIYLDKTNTLYPDSTGNTYEPVLIKLSQKKGFEHLVKFGYNQSTTADWRYSIPAGYFSLCQGKSNEIFVSFTPAGYWGIGNNYFPNSPTPISEGHSVFVKIRDTTTYKDTIPTDTTTSVVHRYIPSQEINIFPNPAQEVVYISSDIPQQQMLVELYTIEGKKLLVKNFNIQGQREFSMLLTGIKPGLYMLRFQNSEGMVQNKILVKQ